MLSLRAQLLDLLGEEPVRPTVDAIAPGLAPGTVAAARQGDADVAIVRLLDGRLCVVPDVCPHDGGRISDGWLENDQLVCARHGWTVDPCQNRCLR